jgi:hypothetical protein
MKPARRRSKPDSRSVVETFGGEYHRLESTFRQKRESSQQGTRSQERRREPPKTEGKPAH